MRTVRLLPMLLVLLAVGSFGVPASHAAGPPGGVPWGYDMRETSVALGENASMIVFGPGNGSVIVSEYVLPFNSTPAVAKYLFYLEGNATNQTAGTNLSHQQVYTNISVPTVGLYVGTVQLCVVDDVATSLGCSRLLLTSGNYTREQGELDNMTQNVTILRDRQQGFFYTVNNFQTAVDVLFWVFIVGWIIVLFAVVVTLTGSANRRVIRKMRKWIHDLAIKTSHLEFGDTWANRAEGKPRVNPERIYRGTAYPKCIRCHVDQTKEEIVSHLLNAHGVSRPIEGPGGTYAIVKSAIRRATASREDDEPDLNVLRDHVDQLEMKNVPAFLQKQKEST